MLSILYCITQNKCVRVLFRWYLSKETTKHIYTHITVEPMSRERGRERKGDQAGESKRIRHAHTYAVNNPKYLHGNKRCCWTFPFVPWFRSFLHHSHPNLDIPQSNLCVYMATIHLNYTNIERGCMCINCCVCIHRKKRQNTHIKLHTPQIKSMPTKCRCVFAWICTLNRSLSLSPSLYHWNFCCQMSSFFIEFSFRFCLCN